MKVELERKVILVLNMYFDVDNKQEPLHSTTQLFPEATALPPEYT